MIFRRKWFIHRNSQKSFGAFPNFEHIETLQKWYWFCWKDETSSWKNKERCSWPKNSQDDGVLKQLHGNISFMARWHLKNFKNMWNDDHQDFQPTDCLLKTLNGLHILFKFIEEKWGKTSHDRAISKEIFVQGFCFNDDDFSMLFIMQKGFINHDFMVEFLIEK